MTKFLNDQPEQRRHYVIVGGSASGASMVAKLRREDEFARITLVERTGYVATAYCGLPYGLGGIVPDVDALVPLSPEDIETRFNAVVLTNTEAIAIDREAMSVEVKDLFSGRVSNLSYDRLVLATGAENFVPALEGVDLPGVFGLRNVYDMHNILEWVEKRNSRSVAILGGGFIGLEAAEAFVHRGMKVALIETGTHVLGKTDGDIAAVLHHELDDHGVHLQLGARVRGIFPVDGRLTVKTDRADIPCDLVLMATGTRPVNALARQVGLQIGETGGIVTNRTMQTSDSNIYCVGDAAEVRCRVTDRPMLVSLASPLAHQASVAAHNIVGKPACYQGALATFVCKVFGKTVAATGASEKDLERQGIGYEKVILPSTDHVGFYPGAQKMLLKVLFEENTGLILGAQCVGGNGVDRRIDVISTAIHSHMTIGELSELELAYAPPYGAPRDPVNLAGSLGRAILTEHVHVLYPDQVDGFISSGGQVIDLREPEEFDANTIAGAINIPAAELRFRLAEIDRERPVAVLCRIGSKAMTCHRMLEQMGFDSYNVIGGHATWWSYNHKPAGVSWEVHAADAVAAEKLPVSVEAMEGFDRVVDATGLTCPGPIMLLKKEAKRAVPGERVLVRASDPGFLADFKSWCNRNGYDVLKAAKNQGVYEGGYASR